ncbi:hypothetical protein NH340_JMT07371 [Sarcoptes scabiei]|nr:hypothetical protein NH340_JMT07371 [Sarcoptes scabiei]
MDMNQSTNKLPSSTFFRQQYSQLQQSPQHQSWSTSIPLGNYPNETNRNPVALQWSSPRPFVQNSLCQPNQYSQSHYGYDGDNYQLQQRRQHLQQQLSCDQASRLNYFDGFNSSQNNQYQFSSPSSMMPALHYKTINPSQAIGFLTQNQRSISEHNPSNSNVYGCSYDNKRSPITRDYEFPYKYRIRQSFDPMRNETTGSNLFNSIQWPNQSKKFEQFPVQRNSIARFENKIFSPTHPLHSSSSNIQSQNLVKKCPKIIPSKTENLINKNLVANCSQSDSNTIAANNTLSIVESTKVILKPQRKITSIGSIDNRKILMSLKSGLLAESTWALDVLTILTSNSHFKISTFPNILQYLIEYLQSYIVRIQDDLFLDTRNDFIKNIFLLRKFDFDCLRDNNNNKNSKDDADLIAKQDAKIFLLDSTNYTFRSRNGLAVRVKNDHLKPRLKRSLNDQNDPEDFFDYDDENFSIDHIITTMQPSNELIPFTKRIKTSCEKKMRIDSVDCYRSFKSANQDYHRDRSQVQNLDSEVENFNLMMNPTLCPRSETIEELSKRSICLSIIIRNLSFSPENGRLMAESSMLIAMLARLLLYSHEHMEKRDFTNMILTQKPSHLCDDVETQKILFEDHHCAELFHYLRMNCFVTLSNLSAFLDLTGLSDKIILPLLDGLLHWAICSSAYACDPLPPDNLSCRLQALEILSKLSIKKSNIDLLLATPPFERIETLYETLILLIDSTSENQVLSEIALIVLAHFASYDSLNARIILHLDGSIINLIKFIEQCEALNMARGMNYIKPFIYADQQAKDIAQQDLYRFKVAANTIKTLASNCEQSDLCLLKKFENRIVNLAMSPFIHPDVIAILADLAFIITDNHAMIKTKQ